MHTIRDRLLQNNHHGMVGREREQDALLRCLDGDAPIVTHVHGMSGIGKTTLLRNLAEQATSAANESVLLDGTGIEPTATGLLHSLSEALGQSVLSPLEAGRVLAGREHPVLLILDHYENLSLLDTWLRQSLLPALPASARLVLASRLPPNPSWLMDPDWHGLFRALHLRPLDDAAARQLVEHAGAPPHAAETIVRFAHGHPLALTMAATLARSEGLDSDAPLERVLHQLSRLYLGSVEDSELRDVLRASSVVRRITVPLIEAVAPTAGGQALLDRIAHLPFIDSDQSGLSLHDAIREAIAADFEACNPEGFRQARRAAWRLLREAAAGTHGGELWRYTADLIYLLRNPAVRDAFFPRESSSLAVTEAQPEHGAAIKAVAGSHEPAGCRSALERLWDRAPQTFSVVLQPEQEVAGFYVMFDPATLPEPLLRDDPITARWWNHLRENRLPRGQCALFLRRWLSWREGEQASPVQAAAWLDIKRCYMEQRPRLRRVYLTLAEPAAYSAVATQLGFRMLPECAVEFEGTTFHTAMLDMGPASVDGWLSWLVGKELGEEEQGLLDVTGRSLRGEAGPVPLTRLEFEVIRYLWERPGQAVARDALLNDIWGRHFDGGSNVVDTVVASLRRKLGTRAALIRTVRGYGYALREEEDDQVRRA
ncbi:winged helix-turn-helix domain-containing protein [Aquibaculum sediminis]|uniref:winged helix-turn-helix domain-containing protein n=1 Tax=Aquibaculum sediminis TaxID=3231907 RepID=UPI003455CFF0